ncbi:sugar phosphate isomerase/epimerase [Rhodobacteraceae bacterium RKSG542]|uniref:sugar phosphate isomerase/epimerase family protein n=1 Tax=Pseudovibrio flavus TaxID=2529854 RepID=UPI0012BC5AB0|nr:sugar phosphate isomerase/epimerase family protein [Pseudovibrio flavus]MTI19135.1 sugar phosphate isomerase/epimerase [Pseudovibrio flavus]
MPSTLPVLGAALTSFELPDHLDWVLEKQRDLELQDFVMGSTLNSDWSEQASSIKAMLSDYRGRLGLHGPFWDAGLGSLDVDVVEVLKKRLMQSLDACEALGATQLVLHSPYTIWLHHNRENYIGAVDGLLDRTQENISEAVQRAENIGCTLVLENAEDVDPDFRRQLVERFDSSALAVSLDTGHAYYAHKTHDGPELAEWVRSAGAHLQHIHLQDCDGLADRHWEMGAGTINWSEFFEVLWAEGSRPRLLIELFENSKIPEAAAHLEKLGLAQ